MPRSRRACSEPAEGLSQWAEGVHDSVRDLTHPSLRGSDGRLDRPEFARQLVSPPQAWLGPDHASHAVAPFGGRDLPGLGGVDPLQDPRGLVRGRQKDGELLDRRSGRHVARTHIGPPGRVGALGAVLVLKPAGAGPDRPVLRPFVLRSS
jgi:hypothetical protein